MAHKHTPETATKATSEGVHVLHVRWSIYQQVAVAVAVPKPALLATWLTGHTRMTHL